MQHLLLIDDQPTLISDMLRIYGYQVDVATDGFSGIQMLMKNESEYNLVILDLHMPKMDGWEVLKTIRNGSICPDIPIMMLTSADTEDDMVFGLRRGADVYLTKPISPKKLLAHLESFDRRNRWHQEAARKAIQSQEHSPQALLELLTQRENEIL